MKRQIPRREPRIFPFVRHGKHVVAVEMRPVVIAAVLAFRWRRRLGRIAVQPFLHVVVKKLFAPDHPRKSLALHHPCISVGNALLQPGVKFIRLTSSLIKYIIEIGKRFSRRRAIRFCQPQPHRGGTARRKISNRKAHQPWCRSARDSPPLYFRQRHIREMRP